MADSDKVLELVAQGVTREDWQARIEAAKAAGADEDVLCDMEELFIAWDLYDSMRVPFLG